MNKLEKEINTVISTWNPLSVPGDIAQSEYSIYISEIVKSKVDYQSLMPCLKSILANMGIEPDLNDIQTDEDLDFVCHKILNL